MDNSFRVIDEIKFMDLFRNRDPKAIEMLYDRFAAVVYGIILRIVKDEITAGEALKETFVYIWKNYFEFDESKQNLFLWMVGIGRKTALEKMPFLSYARNRSDTSIVNHTPTRKVFEQRQAIRKTLETPDLMIEERTALDLVFLGGGKINEVASHLGMNETEVKQLLLKAVNHYRTERREAWK